MALELTTFVGDWTDSLGNDVRCATGGRGVQVSLTKPDGKGREIVLTIKKVGVSSFQCGHYDLDQEHSTSNRIVWRDRRFKDKSSIWTRKGLYDAAVPGSSWQSSQPGFQATAAVACIPSSQASAPAAAAATNLAMPGGQDLSKSSTAWRPPLGPPPVSIHAATATKQENMSSSDRPEKVGVKQENVAHEQTSSTNPGVVPTKLQSMLRTYDETAVSDDEAVKPRREGKESTSDVDDRWSDVLDMLSAAASAPDSSTKAEMDQQQQHQPQQHHHQQQHQLQQQQQPQQQTQQFPQQQFNNGHQQMSAAFLNQANSAHGFMQMPTNMPMNGHPGQPFVMPGMPPPGQVVMPGMNMQMPPVPHLQGASPPVVSGFAGAGGAGGINDLFTSFGMPQAPPTVPVSSGALAAAAASAMGMAGTAQMSEEAIREAVLTETLARLLREKTGAAGSGSAVPPWRRSGTPAEASMPPESNEDPKAASAASTSPASSSLPSTDQQPPPAGKTIHVPLAGQSDAAHASTSSSASPPTKEEAPLDKFIKIFGLDELAAKCLMKLQDDEAAFVIESCQNRLKYAANPSAVVMIAIKSVASKVGRRYYGSREAGEGSKSKDRDSELQFFEGSPASPEANTADSDAAQPEIAAAQFDPYMAAEPAGVLGEDEEVEEEEEEEELVVDQEVDPGAPQAKRARIEKSQESPAAGVLASVAEPEANGEDEDEENAGPLFFVDTGQ
eukprot:TRINITY_DN15975_c0_g5_i1.p1 TRINITY_DN15975_c0_g5~~TRINITY_DN15975_c0_g5_i1.p1  ORF type:complete len:726 (-),score=196.67 TRINITY_DN15975_c0_g5_i1:198-2375(-)